MNTPKQGRRKIRANKLEPIDWHEFANDAVLNGNMSTLYHRPSTEDSTAYASTEALVEIEKRVGRPGQSTLVIDFDADSASGLDRPTVGMIPTVGDCPAVVTAHEIGINRVLGESDSIEATVDSQPAAGAVQAQCAIPPVGIEPTGGIVPTVGMESAVADQNRRSIGTVDRIPTVGIRRPPAEEAQAGQLVPFSPTAAIGRNSLPTVYTEPTVGIKPTVGMGVKRKVKPIRDVQDALTLAGQVLYKAMYGAPDGAKSKSCTKGYRQLAAETHLDKDTVRDLIGDFKDRGIVRETRTYDPDTRSAKTYEVLSYKSILQVWRDAGLVFVTAGRQRPMFCTAQGEPLIFRPTVGIEPPVSRRVDALSIPTVGTIPTVGNSPTVGTVPTEAAGPGAESHNEQHGLVTPVIYALQQITGNPVDQEAADRLITSCRAEAGDCTLEEIIEFAWSKAFLCRSGKIQNPIGFLITQIPKHFQGEALQTYRENKRKELQAAAALVAREDQRRLDAEFALAELEQSQRDRSQIAERHRREQGIDLKALLQDSEADDPLKEWAKRMLKLGHRYQPTL